MWYDDTTTIRRTAMAYTKWNDSEIEMLKYTYPSTNWDEIYKSIPGHDKNSIKYKAISLGLKRPNRKWTTKEIHMLKCIYPDDTTMENIIINIPNKTKSSIITKARRLNLTRPHNIWTKREIDIIKNLYPVTTCKDMEKFLPGRKCNSIRTKACILKVKNSRTYTGNNILGDFTEAEKGYIAGIIDGEGNMGFRKYKVGDREHRTSSYVIYLCISGTSSLLFNWIGEKFDFGGYWTARKNDPIRKPVHSWRVQSNRAIQILKEIYPYLIIKKELAEKLSHGYLHLNMDEREEFIQYVHRFNKRGVH